MAAAAERARGHAGADGARREGPALQESLPGESFEADVVNSTAASLYEIFFEPHTKKFLFYSPAELHRDWGAPASTAP